MGSTGPSEQSSQRFASSNELSRSGITLSHPTKHLILAQGTEASQPREKLYWSQVMVPFLVSIEQQNTMAMIALNRLEGSTSSASLRQLLLIQPLHSPAFDQLSSSQRPTCRELNVPTTQQRHPTHTQNGVCMQTVGDFLLHLRTCRGASS